jgi:hypothetical protein
VIRTRRQWLRAAAVWPACLTALGAQKEFWDRKDPAAWSDDEKQILLSQSPWAQAGLMRIKVEKNQRPASGNGESGTPNAGMPDTRPGARRGGTQGVPIGGPKAPPVPEANPGQSVQFRVLARWESAAPVRLAGGPETPDLNGEFYVIRLQGLPLMLPPKAKPGEAAAPDPNEGALQAIKANSRLERKGKPDIPCSRLFAGSGEKANQILLYFPRGADPITVADKLVTFETRLSLFHLSLRFPLKEMIYKGELAL